MASEIQNMIYKNGLKNKHNVLRQLIQFFILCFPLQFFVSFPGPFHWLCTIPDIIRLE